MMQQPARPELHAKATGAGTSIIGILEVVESDFAKNLATSTTEEDDAEAEYQKVTQANKVTKTMKSQDVKYKTQEYTGLDKNVAAMSADRETADTELSAVMDYYGKVKDRCIAKPETYEQRKARREAEINGLKQALSILNDETAFVQRGKRVRGAAQYSFLETSARRNLLRAKRACPNTELSTSNSANAAGTAVFSAPSAEDDVCVLVGQAINTIKFCGPGDLKISRMTCDKHHDYKSETISHPSSSWTKGQCEDVPLAGTVADGHLGSYTLDC